MLMMMTCWMLFEHVIQCILKMTCDTLESGKHGFLRGDQMHLAVRKSAKGKHKSIFCLKAINDKRDSERFVHMCRIASDFHVDINRLDAFRFC